MPATALPTFSTGRVMRALEISNAQQAWWARCGAYKVLDAQTTQGIERRWTVRDIYMLAIIQTLTKLFAMKADAAAGAARLAVDAVDEHTIKHVNELCVIYTPTGTEIRFNADVMEAPPPADAIAVLSIDLRRLFADVKRRFEASEPRLDASPATEMETIQ